MALDWALVALKSGFRTRFNTALSKFPFSLPFNNCCLSLLRVKGHVQDRLSSQGMLHSLACLDCGRKIAGNPACRHGVNIPHHTERPWVGILTRNLSLRSEGGHFWIIAKPFPPASSEDQLPRLVLIILSRQLAGEEIASIDGRKTWNHAESCQIVSLARHAKNVGWERGLALHFHNATHRICWSILPRSLWKHGPGSCREEP